MRQNAVLAGLARRAASGLCGLLALLLVTLGAAQAGDRATLQIMGYSEDGRYFAFEEFGEHDSSGGVYSSIYVVDLTSDSWVPGTPFTVDQGGDMDETPPLATVRTKAHDTAAPTLSRLGLGAPADILALLGDGVPDADGKSMVVANTICCSPGATDDHHLSFALTTFPAKSPEDYCSDMDVVGYALMLDDGTTRTTLHKDGAMLPRSRGCTVDYRLYAVLAPVAGNGPWVVIISAYPFGFEGPDRRFLAVSVNTP